MRKIPLRYASYVYGVIQAGITTAVATAIATLQMGDNGEPLMLRWATSWLLAWMTMLPVVILVAPMIQRAVASITDDGRASRQ